MGETYSYYPGCTSHSTAIEYIEASKAVIEALGIELKELPDFRARWLWVFQHLMLLRLRKLGLTW